MGLQKTLATSRLHWTNCGLVTSKKENNSVLLRLIVIGMINCFSSNEMLSMEDWRAEEMEGREGTRLQREEALLYCRVICPGQQQHNKGEYSNNTNPHRVFKESESRSL